MINSHRRRNRPATFALAALLLLVQLGVFAHTLEHQLDQGDIHCELCMLADHLGSAPPSTGLIFNSNFVQHLTPLNYASTFWSRAVSVYHARGPPLSRSF